MKKMVIMGLILSAVTAGAYGNDDGISSFKIGQFEIFALVESERDGNAGILVGADEAILQRYIPEQGFRHTANAFLVKTPRMNILIDTGTGSGDIIINKVKSLGIEPEKINAVLITHLHGDHFGSLQREGKAVFPNAKVYLSKKELEHFTVSNPNQGAVAALAPYKSSTVTFEPAALSARRKPEILPGVIPIAAYGHTPGHTIFQLESGRDKFLVIADLLHVALVQFPMPSISATYDIDQALAARTRQEVLSYAAQNKIPIGGMHIVNPAMGTVEANKEGGFIFKPAQ